MARSPQRYTREAADHGCDASTPRHTVTAHVALVAAGCLLALFATQSGTSGIPPGRAVGQGEAADQRLAGAAPASSLAPDPHTIPLLVTKERPLEPLFYAPADLVSIAGTRLSAVAAWDLYDMVGAAAADGVTIITVSGYRSYVEQQNLHARYVATFGAGRAAELSAEPGHSEHQTGLAVDIADPSGECALMECFADTPAGAWVAENAWKYGFIVRYPAAARVVTGYTYEPWHLRHVGVETAAEMHRTMAPTLEAYLAGQERPTAR